MLPVTLDAVRLYLHVLAATVWVGGQIVLASVVPVLRQSGPEALTPTARRFRAVAWPSYLILLFTGIWNLEQANFSHQPNAWVATVMVKITLFVAAGALTAGHTAAGARARQAPDEPRWRAVTGATAGLALLASLAALFLGVQLTA